MWELENKASMVNLCRGSNNLALIADAPHFLQIILSISKFYRKTDLVLLRF